jgi:hypothetical protein
LSFSPLSIMLAIGLGKRLILSAIILNVEILKDQNS